MEGMIVVSQVLTATNADILQGTRLQTVPSNGVLNFEMQADLNDATNNYTAAIELPDGATPMNGVAVPGGNPALGGVLDERHKLEAGFVIGQGGHCVFSVTETGSAICFVRVTFVPSG